MHNGLGAAKTYAAQNGNGGLAIYNENLSPKIKDYVKSDFQFGVKSAFIETSRIKRLFRNQFLKRLPDDDFKRLLGFLEIVSLTAGAEICRADEFVEYIYFPENAVFSHLNISEDGQTNELAMTGSEGIAGLAAILDDRPSKFWMRISVAGTALKIKTEIFKLESVRGGMLQSALFNYLNSFITQISHRIVCNSNHLIEKRLCCWLLMIHDRAATDNLKLTHEQIAGYLGVNRPSVTYTTSHLRENKIIDYERGNIRILDRRKLENNSCACYSAIR